MSKIVVISGHPNLDESYTNSVILDELSTKLDAIEVRRLDKLYPDYKIDVEKEQAALAQADIIVLQYPFYWYSVPALLKKWIDDVMSFNFAYGPEGDKLKNKSFILSFTVGGPEESYDPLGYNHFPIEQFLYPLQQTAYLAGMLFQKPVYTNRMVYIPNVYNELDEVQARAKDHAARLIEQINQLTSSPESRVKRFVSDWFAAFDALTEPTERFTAFMAEDIVINMPEGEFKGHEGFATWYENIKKIFKPNCSHDVEQFSIKPSEQGYQVELRIRLKAETFESSAMAGKNVDINVNETWQLSLDDNGKVTIFDYQVVPLS